MTTTSHGSFIIERRYNAAPERVFAAWSDAKAKRTWFAEGEGWDIKSYELDFREGGAETSKFRFLKGEETFGEETWFGNDTVFNEVVENERIVMSYEMHLDATRISVSLGTTEIKPNGAGSTLIYTEQGAYLDGYDDAGQREEGTQQLFNQLDAFLQS
jgi:uncharacterized protein YndB with AHSA1/START domain